MNFHLPSRPFLPTRILARTVVALLAATTLGGIVLTTGSASAQTLDQPLPRSVFQRDASNQADIPIQVDPLPHAVRARALVKPGFQGTSVGWTSLQPAGDLWQGLRLEAGGWYRIDVEVTPTPGATPLILTTDRVGVGEVFVTAGQSNSANHGELPQTPRHDTVSAYDIETETWVFAADPQPVATVGNGTDRGSVWPLLGDLLVERLGVPVGFASVGVGSSPIRQWLPSSPDIRCGQEQYNIPACYPRLQKALLDLGVGGVRAVLWHQGESDAVNNTPTSTYTSWLLTVIDQTRVDTQWEVPWYVALATRLDNTSPVQQHTIVSAQQLVIDQRRLVLQGAATDDLEGDYRYSGDLAHFSILGLQEHARRWADVLAPPEPAHRHALAVRIPSLEAPSVADGVVAVGGGGANPPPWTATAGAFYSIINPGPNDTCGGDDNGAFGGTVPGLEGRQIGRLWNGADGVGVWQTLAGPNGVAGNGDDPFPESDTHYAVEMAVGNRPDVTDGGYRLELRTTPTPLTVDSGQVVALATSAITPAASYAFHDVGIGWTASTTDVGQALAIRFSKPKGGNPPTYAAFDDVRASSLPVTRLYVENPGFEQPVVTVDGGILEWSNDLTGWQGMANLRIKNPLETDYPGADLNGTAPGMEGSQVAQLWRGNPGDGIRQVLRGENGAPDPVLEANSWYQLTVAVGHRATGLIFGGYTLQIVALGTTPSEDRILASSLGALPPAGPGEWTDVHVRFATTEDSPDLGKTLEIRLLKNLGGALEHPFGHIDFDNVRMLSAAMPELDNPSFEEPMLFDGVVDFGVPNGWAGSGDTMQDGDLHVRNPVSVYYTDADDGSPTQGTAPGMDGKQTFTLWRNGKEIDQAVAGDSQTLLLEPRRVYTASVAVGERLTGPPGSFSVELLAIDGSGEVSLAKTQGDSATTTAGRLVDVTVSYTTAIDDPHLGKELRLRLNLAAGHVDLDDVRIRSSRFDGVQGGTSLESCYCDDIGICPPPPPPL